MPSIAVSRWIVPGALWLGMLLAVIALSVTGQAGAAWSLVRDAQILPISLVVIIGAILPIIHATRWQCVMRALGSDMSTVLAADMTVSSSLINYASPGYMGVSAKAFLANRTTQVPYSRSLLSMAFEQGLDFTVLLATSMIAVLVLGPHRFVDHAPSADRGRQLAVLAATFIVITLMILARNKLIRVVGRITTAFRTLHKHVDWSVVAVLTLTYWTGQLIVVALLMWSLHLSATPAAVLGIGTIPMLVGQVVPIPGGIGAREATIVALSGIIDASVGALLGFAILQRVLLVAALPLSLGILRLVRLLHHEDHI